VSASIRLAAALALVAGWLAAGGPAAATGSPEEALADRYSPVVVVRQQLAVCGDGEPYVPVAVETVLGRDDVVLRGPDGGVVTPAPTAADLAGRGDGYYLDFPGRPLTPGCDYDRWARSLPGSSEPTVYARVATDPDHPGMLALQYWFFYVYNDWNDRHEGDWEMIQLLFPAESAQQALTTTPLSVAFAQHEGSEVAAWDDPKLLRDGDHVAVYPGQGSHAAYFTQSEWFGKSAAAGFGCDNTSGPGTILRPAVVVLPTKAPAPAGEFAWLSFTGRWGERAPSFNNGPTGPAMKAQWAAPVTWQEEEGRLTAVPVPIVAGAAASAFCSLTSAGSMLFMQVLASPGWTVAAVLGVVVALVLVWRSTRWRGSSPEPLDQQRRAGQVVVTAFGLVWRRRPLVFLPIGLAFLVVLAVITRLERLIVQPDPTTGLDTVGMPTLTALPAVVAVVSALLVLPAAAIAVSACLHALAGPLSAPRALLQAVRSPAGAVAYVILYFLAAVSLGALVLLPLGLWILARWAVGSPAAVFGGVSAPAGLRASAELTAGHRWRTLALTALLAVIAVGAAPLVGALLLLLTPITFPLAEWVVGLLVAALLPVAAVGLGLQYLDLRARQEG